MNKQCQELSLSSGSECSSIISKTNYSSMSRSMLRTYAMLANRQILNDKLLWIYVPTMFISKYLQSYYWDYKKLAGHSCPPARLSLSCPPARLSHSCPPARLSPNPFAFFSAPNFIYDTISRTLTAQRINMNKWKRNCSCYWLPMTHKPFVNWTTLVDDDALMLSSTLNVSRLIRFY